MKQPDGSFVMHVGGEVDVRWAPGDDATCLFSFVLFILTVSFCLSAPHNDIHKAPKWKTHIAVSIRSIFGISLLCICCVTVRWILVVSPNKWDISENFLSPFPLLLFIFPFSVDRRREIPTSLLHKSAFILFEFLCVRSSPFWICYVEQQGFNKQLWGVVLSFNKEPEKSQSNFLSLRGRRSHLPTN